MTSSKTRAKAQPAKTLSSDLRMSLLISAFMVLHVFTYKSFFFINPLEALTPWLTFTQVLSMIGWISLTLLPPVLLHFKIRIQKFDILFFASWATWPVALLLIRIGLFANTGNAFVDYLATYPIFMFSDILVPIVYFLIWRNHKRMG
jgi:hypothetical protein